MEVFYLGTHQPSWLAELDVPLFVSHRRLANRRRLPRARVGWALDSGGFTELSMYGQWRTSPEEYVAAVRRHDAEVGKLSWAAPQDWMCEPFILAKTGRTVADHQARTIDNFKRLHGPVVGQRAGRGQPPRLHRPVPVHAGSPGLDR